MPGPIFFPVPADVFDKLRFLDVDPRGLADFHYQADGSESLKLAVREKALDASSGSLAYEAVASYGGLLIGLIFVVGSESELRERLTVLEVLGS